MNRWIWLIAVVVIVVLCYVVPFVVLDGVDHWYGSFLFWSVATVAVIGMNAVVSAGWRD